MEAERFAEDVPVLVSPALKDGHFGMPTQAAEKGESEDSGIRVALATRLARVGHGFESLDK